MQNLFDAALTATVIDPCSDDGCSLNNLEPASFNSSAYGTFQDQQCSINGVSVSNTYAIQLQELPY